MNVLLDAVILAVPNRLHEPPTLEALAAFRAIDIQDVGSVQA
jgi:predicted dehydrogenase